MFHETYRFLLQDILAMCLYSYADVRKKAQSLFMIAVKKFHFNLLQSMLPQVIQALSSKESTDEERTGILNIVVINTTLGAIYILEKGHSIISILLDWTLLKQFMLSMCQTDHVEKVIIINV